MPPDHDHFNGNVDFNGSVDLNDAESVMREIVSPIPVVLARPQQGSLAFQVRVPNAVTAAAGRTVSLVPFTVPQDRCEERYVAPLAGLTADPGTEPGAALVPCHSAEQSLGTT